MITHECSGCGSPTDHVVSINSESESVCADCQHDSLFTCPDCLGRFWVIDGVRMSDKQVICASCSAWRPREIEGRMRELARDGARDSFDDVRRG